MRQKFVISRDGTRNELNIKEYAVIDKNLKKVAATIVQKESFTFLCEETYKSEAIVNSISKGTTALIASLRTHNMFPIEPNATRIAESVTALYNSSENDSVELFFDDIELFSVAE